MIHNEREYRISINILNRLEIALKEDRSEDIPEWVSEAHSNALLSQIEEIGQDIEDYENLRSGEVFIWECPDLRDLPEYLIKARIASGLSQKELAEILNLKAQQIQRYESSYYKGANLNRLIDVATAVGVKVSGFIEKESRSVDSKDSLDESSGFGWERFPKKEMLERGWISAAENIQSYITQFSGEHFSAVLHRKKIYAKNKPNMYSLIAWQARVMQKAARILKEENIPEFHLDDSWLDEFVKLSKQDDSPVASRSFLASKGIMLVIERHLEKTYLDGAAMMFDSGNPVIALTLRHDRLDNFWFVLMHELGHVFRHLAHGFNMEFFDEENGNGIDAVEREADEFALENLIPNQLWELCVSKYTMNSEAVLSDAERLSISPAIIAGRVRKESGNYYVLNDLVGNGTVRKSLEGYY